MVLEYPAAHNFTVSLFLVGHPHFTDAKMALFSFTPVKWWDPGCGVNPRVDSIYIYI